MSTSTYPEHRQLKKFNSQLNFCKIQLAELLQLKFVEFQWKWVFHAIEILAWFLVLFFNGKTRFAIEFQSLFESQVHLKFDCSVGRFRHLNFSSEQLRGPYKFNWSPSKSNARTELRISIGRCSKSGLDFCSFFT